MGVKLHNIGKRSIEYGKGHYFKSGARLEFPEDEAAKLQRLYPEEIQSLEDVMAAFEQSPSMPAEEPIAPEPEAPAPAPEPERPGRGKGNDKPAV